MRVPALLLTAVILAGCGDHQFEPPSREARVQEAAAAYSPAVYDTVAWPGDSAREFTGNVVYSSQCRDCHGTLGRGGTAYARERGLEVASLVEPGWDADGDLEEVRRRIFVGHPDGMPTWGVAGITPREIDAVAFYIVARLRPEVLEGESVGGTAP